jgi:hypothetical protein
MPEPHDHGENHIELLPVEPVAMSLGLRMHDVLRTQWVANTVAYLATVLLRAHEADAAASAETPAQPFVPLIYRSLIYRDGRKHEADDVIDLETGERVALPSADVPCALPAPTRSAARLETSQPNVEVEVEIPDD